MEFQFPPTCHVIPTPSVVESVDCDVKRALCARLTSQSTATLQADSVSYRLRRLLSQFYTTTNCFHRRILYQLGESAGRGASTSLLFRASRAWNSKGFCVSRIHVTLLANTKTTEDAIEHRFRYLFARHLAQGLDGAPQVNSPKIERQLLCDRDLHLLQGKFGAR